MSMLQGTIRPVDVRAQIPATAMGIAANWFVNRNPLFARLAKRPVGTPTFQMKGFKFRPRLTTLTADPSTGTTLTVADASLFMNGDVVMLSTGEFCELVADPNISANTLTVRRGVGTAPPAVVAAGAIAGFATPPAGVVILIGNSRTGAEVLQKAIAALPSLMTQYIQHFQHVVSVGGGTQAIDFNNSFSGYLPQGVATPYAAGKMEKLQNIIDDLESAAILGMGEAMSSTNTRPKMYGLKNLITTNKVTAPVGASAYTALAFHRDAIQPILAAGGRPSAIFTSVDFATGLQTWGSGLQRFDAGQTVFGLAIDTYSSPFLAGGASIIPSPMLPAGSALTLSADEVYWAFLEALNFVNYGVIGDAIEGHWIARMAIAVENEAHHSWVSGITGWAA